MAMRVRLARTRHAFWRTMFWQLLMPVVLLCVSNVFMTFAWYGQLRFPGQPLWLLILAGWEYRLCGSAAFAVPLVHYYRPSPVLGKAQLKTMQECRRPDRDSRSSSTYLGETAALEPRSLVPSSSSAPPASPSREVLIDVADCAGLRVGTQGRRAAEVVSVPHPLHRWNE